MRSEHQTQRKEIKLCLLTSIILKIKLVDISTRNKTIKTSSRQQAKAEKRRGECKR